mmetsp:Transcript_4438/g.10698  ORF Transcript_4438/g.10698 Transcript_4438/m.10698 type:complete len:213 (+) Transcript_4438:2374-3012(+)
MFIVASRILSRSSSRRKATSAISPTINTFNGSSISLRSGYVQTSFSVEHLEMLDATHIGYLLELVDGAGCKLEFLLRLVFLGNIISSSIFFAVILTSTSFKLGSPVSSRFMGRLRRIPQRQASLATWAISALIIALSAFPRFVDSIDVDEVSPLNKNRHISTVQRVCSDVKNPLIILSSSTEHKPTQADKAVASPKSTASSTVNLTNSTKRS